MRIPIAIAALALAGFAGCGGGADDEGTIPPENAQSLLEQLDGVRTAIADGNCTTARTDATQFVDEVNKLPEETGVTIKEPLREAGQHLDQLVVEECEDTGVTGVTGTAPVEEAPEEVAPVEPAAPPFEEDDDEESTPEQPPGEGGGPPSEDGSGGVGDEKGKQKAGKKGKDR